LVLGVDVGMAFCAKWGQIITRIIFWITINMMNAGNPSVLGTHAAPMVTGSQYFIRNVFWYLWPVHSFPPQTSDHRLLDLKVDSPR